MQQRAAHGNAQSSRGHRNAGSAYTHHVFELAIGDGEWWQDELGDNIVLGGWVGDFSEVDGATVNVKDHDTDCTVTYSTSLNGDTLAVDVAELNGPDCTEFDTATQVAIIESAPFQLVEVADWQAPEPAPEATLDPALPLPTPIRSTSGDRQISHPAGTMEGAPLGYLEYLPATYSDDGEPSPLLVFLHGSGESGDGSEFALESLKRGGIPQLIANNRWPEERPFVVLSPQHDDSEPPNFCMESSEIDELLRFALEHYNVDPVHVYLTGLSCGAIGLWNYLTAHGGELIAAAVPIAGFGITTIGLLGCDVGRTPIWAFHGALDDAVPVHGDVYPITALQACTDPAPVDARLTVFPLSGHDVWTRTYQQNSVDDIYSWMLSHTK